MTGAKNQGNERILHGKKLVGKHFFIFQHRITICLSTEKNIGKIIVIYTKVLRARREVPRMKKLQ